jgi:hypothetical protein
MNFCKYRCLLLIWRGGNWSTTFHKTRLIKKISPYFQGLQINTGCVWTIMVVLSQSSSWHYNTHKFKLHLPTSGCVLQRNLTEKKKKKGPLHFFCLSNFYTVKAICMQGTFCHWTPDILVISNSGPQQISNSLCV